jgi:predicted ATPase
MDGLPTGTVTFLFTDIEGSTRLLQELGDAYADALAEHRRLLREAFGRHGGVEVDTQGDAFFVAFAHATEALAAAAEGQRALAHGPIRVRMGLHTGEPVVTQEGYVGLDVHKGARIAAVAHGAQVVLSTRTRELLDSEFVLDLGRHRLKDLVEPERLYQLGDGEFPPLRSLNASNLPVQPTPLVGRRRELAEILRLVRAHPLVTLTGPGGSGKTRLALQAAEELVNDFPDGVWFVSLAAVREPVLIESTIAQTLGVREPQTVAEHLSNKQALLLLDNFEQLLEAAPQLAALLGQAAELRLLVTSRARLHLGAERDYPVSPLVDDEATRLFSERAQVAQPSFVADEHVPEICRRLDNLPLAIELAAARLRVLTTDALLARLQQRLPLLTGGARDLPERQRTLRATIEWSYDLLDQPEQLLFARLSVFAGSFDVEAAERITEADLDTLASLIDKSLLRQTEDGRFFVLETLREYSAERLETREDADGVRARHAAYFAGLAEKAGEALHGPAQQASLAELERELRNLRAALSWSLEHDARLAGRLTGALAQFWYIHGGWSEGLTAAEKVLTRGLPRPVTIGALFCSALLAVALETDTGPARAEELLEVSRAAGSAWGTGRALMLLGWTAALAGDHDRANDVFRECLGAAREADDEWLAGVAMHDLADVAVNIGNYDDARQLLEESRAIARARGDDDMVARSTVDLGQMAVRLGDRDDAIRLFDESLRRGRAIGAPDVVAANLTGLAAAIADRDSSEAARLLGAADAALAEIGAARQPIEQATYADALAALLRHLTQERLNDELAAGSAFTRDHAIDEALSFARRRAEGHSRSLG